MPTATPTPVPAGVDPPVVAAGLNGVAGDCDQNTVVTIDELIRGVNIALENNPASDCPAFDANGDSRVTITELIQAVGRALDGC